ncbi:MAG TPA: HipA domain-containing protein [Ilumatobacter sp.]|nr:HipA domain-containing protein [Ilumatobacter sp.]
MPDLAVDLHGDRLGTLAGDWRTFDFRFDRSAVERFGLGSRVLSESVPVALSMPRSGADRRRNFFAELLPEGDALEVLAQRAGLREYDTVNMLARYGRDVAGALQIWDRDDPREPRTARAVPTDELEIEQALLTIGQAPLGNRTADGKTSLNGVQPKLVLARTGTSWSFVEDGWPSSHIIKPPYRSSLGDAHHNTMIFDEEYGERLARSIGLISYDVAIERFGELDALVIERYDRDLHSPDGRIHQEDMCQALGVPRTHKYQEHGGRLTLQRVAGLAGARFGQRELVALARRVAFAVAIGDLDVHGKNISILRPADADPTFAPPYDCVPLRHQPNDQRLAMSINGKYHHAHITLDDLVAEIESWGVRSGAREIVETTIAEIRSAANQEQQHDSAYPALRDDIIRFATRLLEGQPIG